MNDDMQPYLAPALSAPCPTPYLPHHAVHPPCCPLTITCPTLPADPSLPPLTMHSLPCTVAAPYPPLPPSTPAARPPPFRPSQSSWQWAAVHQTPRSWSRGELAAKSSLWQTCAET